MLKVVAYQCEFCRRKVGMNVTHIGAHERLCFHNPHRKACQTCANLTVEFETVYNRYHGGNPGSTDYETSYEYCAAKEKPRHEIPVCEQHECSEWKFKQAGDERQEASRTGDAHGT